MNGKRKACVEEVGWSVLGSMVTVEWGKEGMCLGGMMVGVGLYGYR